MLEPVWNPCLKASMLRMGIVTKDRPQWRDWPIARVSSPGTKGGTSGGWFEDILPLVVDELPDYCWIVVDLLLVVDLHTLVLLDEVTTTLVEWQILTLDGELLFEAANTLVDNVATSNTEVPIAMNRWPNKPFFTVFSFHILGWMNMPRQNICLSIQQYTVGKRELWF